MAQLSKSGTQALDQLPRRFVIGGGRRAWVSSLRAGEPGFGKWVSLPQCVRAVKFRVSNDSSAPQLWSDRLICGLVTPR